MDSRSPTAGDLGAEHDRFLRRHAALLGIAWRKYRRRQSRRGLAVRLRATRVKGLSEYAELLRRSPAERERLVTAMHVTVSRFYRDPRVWSGLEREVLPRLAAALGAGGALRVWSAGCASGEEPYSLSLAWSRAPQASDRALEVLATDLDRAVLERARAAVYDEGSLRAVPEEPRERAFERLPSGELRLRARWREAVRFERHDLLVDPPPTGRQLVLCRYLVLTYFRGERLRRALERLHTALVPGGALVVGEREPLPPEAERCLAPWGEAPCVYRFVRAPGDC